MSLSLISKSKGESVPKLYNGKREGIIETERERERENLCKRKKEGE